MRKLRITALAAFGVLAITAVAIAAQVNVYGVTASTSPTKAGTVKKPVPTEVNFNYTVDEQDGKRPAAVKKYSIFFKGLNVNTAVYKKACTADQINASGDPAQIDPKGAGDEDDQAKACPSGSQVGAGFIRATVGPDSDETSDGLYCKQYLKLYNGGKNKLTLFLYAYTPPGGGFAQEGDDYCVVNFGKAIAAKYVKKNGGTAVEFDVPSTVLHNVPGTTTAVRVVESKIFKKTRKISGKTRGYYESVGGCKNKKREVSVTFTPESGAAQTKKTTAKCS